MNRRPSATSWLGDRAGDHPDFFEGIEMLAQRGVGETELGGKICRSCRLDALQPFNDSALGVGQLCHPTHSIFACPISEAAPCIIIAQPVCSEMSQENDTVGDGL